MSPARDPPEGWEHVESSSSTPFDAGPVTVRAETSVYEDRRRRERIAADVGVDALWRFFFESDLALEPAVARSGALRRLVTDRASAGFADQLRDRGLVAVAERGERRLAVGDETARATRYEAENRLDGATVAVEGYVAVWPGGEAYRLGGGAYPVAVDGDLSAALSDAVTPNSDRSELFGLLRRRA